MKDYELIPQEFVEQIAKNGRASMYEVRNIARELKALRAERNAKPTPEILWNRPQLKHLKPRNLLTPTQQCDSLCETHPGGKVRCGLGAGHFGLHKSYDPLTYSEWQWQ